MLRPGKVLLEGSRSENVPNEIREGTKGAWDTRLTTTAVITKRLDFDRLHTPACDQTPKGSVLSLPTKWINLPVSVLLRRSQLLICGVTRWWKVEKWLAGCWRGEPAGMGANTHPGATRGDGRKEATCKGRFSRISKTGQQNYELMRSLPRRRRERLLLWKSRSLLPYCKLPKRDVLSTAVKLNGIGKHCQSCRTSFHTNANGIGLTARSRKRPSTDDGRPPQTSAHVTDSRWLKIRFAP